MPAGRSGGGAGGAPDSPTPLSPSGPQRRRAGAGRQRGPVAPPSRAAGGRGRVEVNIPVLFLACDAWRASACQGRTSLVVDKDTIAQGEARLRRRAREEGWTQEPGENGILRDACPTCSYARFAAEVAGVPVPPRGPGGPDPSHQRRRCEGNRAPVPSGRMASTPAARESP